MGAINTDFLTKDKVVKAKSKCSIIDFFQLLMLFKQSKYALALILRILISFKASVGFISS